MSRIYYENEKRIKPDEIKTFIEVCLQHRNDRKRLRRANRAALGDWILSYSSNFVYGSTPASFLVSTVYLGSIIHKNHGADEWVIRLVENEYLIGKSYTREEVDEILTQICLLML